MWTDQTAGMIRQLIQVVAGVLVTLGWISQGTVDANLGVILQIVGPALAIGGIIWSWRANRKTAIVAAASKFPETQEMTFSDPKLAQAAKQADPNTVVNVS